MNDVKFENELIGLTIVLPIVVAALAAVMLVTGVRVMGAPRTVARDLYVWNNAFMCP